MLQLANSGLVLLSSACLPPEFLFTAELRQRPNYCCFCDALAADLRLSATAGVSSCADNTEVRLTTGCTVADELAWCVRAFAADKFCLSVGAATLAGEAS